MDNQIENLEKAFGFKMPIEIEILALTGKKIVNVIELEKKLQSIQEFTCSLNNHITEKYGKSVLRSLESNLNQL